MRGDQPGKVFLPAAPAQMALPALVAPAVLPVRLSNPAAKVDPVLQVWSTLNLTQKVFLAMHAGVLAAVAYHGYKRNGGSVPWGAAWVAGGMACPTAALGFALTQGFGKEEK